ncbi:hypothetical protein B0H13DRAFT_1854761 [Mycena leptocephala]|nr:hypothetical protein B0H13DRAFT_1854761 [Mycena leptocephala]
MQRIGVFMTCLLLSLFALTSAVLTNHTIDDQAPSGVVYLPAGDRQTTLQDPGHAIDFDRTKLFNGTVSYFSDITNNNLIQVNFTGNAIYVFAAVPFGGDDVTLGAQCLFLIDSVVVHEYSANSSGAYNISAYSNGSIPDGAHTLEMELPSLLNGNVFALDYIVYTSNDSDPMGSSTSGHETSTSSSSGPSSGASTATQNKRIHIPAIVGTVVAVIAAFLAGLLLCWRAFRRRTIRRSSFSDNSAFGGALMSGDQPTLEPDAPSLAQELQTLKEEFRQFRQQAEGSSSETTSVMRSLSTMKRDQTRALQDRLESYEATDSLVHTNGGLRLTAGRQAVDELPPTYVED